MPGPTPAVTITQTVLYTPPPPVTYRTLYNFNGRGKKQTDLFEIPGNFARWRICYRFTGDTNAIIVLLDAKGQHIDTVLNEIGSYSDCTVRYESTGASYALELQGNYAITIDATG